MSRRDVGLTPFELSSLGADGVEASANDEQAEDDTGSFVPDRMRAQLPSRAILLGTIEREVVNWTTWQIHDEYYVTPWGEDDCALFRISWDDNWERWEWQGDARIAASATDPMEAARLMLTALWVDWGIDLEHEDNGDYRELLESLHGSPP